jgi:hypothetical protein
LTKARKFINLIHLVFNSDDLAKSLKLGVPVIPANPGSGSGAGAGNQYFQRLINTLDSGFHQ